MSQNRRDFIKNSLLASAGTLLVPQFLQAMHHQSSTGFKGKRLVIIQLSGGNDGLNTVIPYENDLYYNARPILGIPKNEVITLDHELGLNPSLMPLRELYDQGLLTILNGVGYPNPNRSHFRSMDIWQTGSAADEYLKTGWIGRYLDAACHDCQKPYHAIEADDTLSLALKGNALKGIAVKNPRMLYRSTRGGHLDALNQYAKQHNLHEQENDVGYLYKTLMETQSSAEYIWEQSKIYKTSVDYPQNGFAKNLKMIAELIGSGIETQVFYASMSGFDTHANQKGAQGNLLKQWAESLKAFTRDLKQSGALKDTLIVTFSEFGRRVKENASRGTDHGTANSVFVVGEGLKKQGIYNSLPSLNDLDNGDLKYNLDFRRLYATILRNWLKTNDKAILGESFDLLNLV